MSRKLTTIGFTSEEGGKITPSVFGLSEIEILRQCIRNCDGKFTTIREFTKESVRSNGAQSVFFFKNNEFDLSEIKFIFDSHFKGFRPKHYAPRWIRLYLWFYKILY